RIICATHHDLAA
ncbi:hypothetical protein MKD33_00290, partial [Chromobacterium piscinae]